MHFPILFRFTWDETNCTPSTIHVYSELEKKGTTQKIEKHFYIEMQVSAQPLVFEMEKFL